MAVLSDKDLLNVVKGDEGIMILNMSSNNITGVGYDLTIGFICDSETGEIPEIYAEDSNRYVLLPGHRYLVISKEFLYLSSKYMATLHSRGSYALKGIIVASTVIDPNYIGFITGSLFNCTSEEVYIKKNNAFTTMVIHELCTPTEISLQKNENNRPMDAQETLHSKYPNIAQKACEAGDIYYAKARKEIDYEYEKLKKRMYDRRQKTQPLQKDSKEVLQDDKQKTRITFLIGNGFDLKMGLATRYSDFYEYYTEKQDDELTREIKENISEWSDLETALGKCTEKFENKDYFWECEKNLEICLVNYLEEQMKRINIDEKKRREIAYGMKDSLMNFYKALPEFLQSHIKKNLPDKSELIDHYFITFNYTDTLEQCLQIVNDEPMDEIWFNDISERILHIHGMTKLRNIVLGVNDESQIANIEFKNNIIDRERLIKEEIQRNESSIIERANAIIDASSIICIFGMSIGATDKKWWKRIAKWLQDDNARRLVIFARDKESHEIEKYANECERETKDRFKNNGELADVWKQIQNQVHVKVDADIFNFKMI